MSPHICSLSASLFFLLFLRPLLATLEMSEAATERRLINEAKREAREREREERREEKREEKRLRDEERSRKAAEKAAEQQRRLEEKERLAAERAEHKQDTEEVQEMKRRATMRLRDVERDARRDEAHQRKRQRIQATRERGMTLGVAVQSADDVDPSTALLEGALYGEEEEATTRHNDAREALEGAEVPRDEHTLRRGDNWFAGVEEYTALRLASDSGGGDGDGKRESKEIARDSEASPRASSAATDRQQPRQRPGDDGSNNNGGNGGDDGDDDGDDDDDDDDEDDAGESEDDEDDGREAPADDPQNMIDALAANLGADAGGGGGGGGDMADYEAIPLEGTHYNWCAGMPREAVERETRACLPDPDVGFAPYCILCITEPWSTAVTARREDGKLSPVAMFYKYIHNLIRNAVGFDQRVRLIQTYVHDRLRQHLKPIYQNKWCALAVIAAHFNSHDLSARAVVDKQLRQLTVLQNTLAKSGVMMRNRVTGATCLDLKATKVLMDLADKQVSFALRHETMAGTKKPGVGAK